MINHKESAVRKHYMTLCLRDNTEVTHIRRPGYIEVSFEAAIKGGFKTVLFNLNTCDVIKNEGFNDSEIDYYKRFLIRNRELIIEDSEGKL